MTDYRPLARSAAAAALTFLILISGAHARDAETSDATRSFQRLMLLGESYKRIGKYDRALQKFRAAAKADPEAADKALLEIGLILTIQEQYQAAADVFSKALAGKLDDEGEKQARRGLAVAVRAGKLDPQPYQSKHTKPWQLYASVAGEIVDGLAVEDQINLGLIVRESDKRLRYRFGGAYSVAVPGAGGKATLGYDFSQSVYSRFEAFDLQTHRGYFRYERALSDRFSFTGDYDFTFYRLGENSRALSSAHRIGVSGLYKLKPRHFLRSNVGYKYTNFRSFSQQDNRTTRGSIGYVYQLPTPLKGVVSGDFVYESANAQVDTFSYNSPGVYLFGQLEHAAWRPIYGPGGRVSLYLSAVGYSFDQAQANDNGIIRRDNVYSVTLRYGLKIWKNVEPYVAASLSDTRSNLDRQDFTSRSITIGIDARF